MSHLDLLLTVALPLLLVVVVLLAQTAWERVKSRAFERRKNRELRAFWRASQASKNS